MTDHLPAASSAVRGRAAQRAMEVQRWQGGESLSVRDVLAAEEPLQILLDGQPLSVVMRTPGHDLELTLGLLHGEGLIRAREDVARVRVSSSGQVDQDDDGLAVEWLALEENLVDVCLRRPADVRTGWQRSLISASACGLCGAATLAALEREWPAVPVRESLDPSVLYRLPGELRSGQAVFASTGGLHAAGLFDTSGRLLCLREDVGRHNAVDKVIGDALLRGALPLAGRCLMLSGRAGFEILQKAAAAGVPIVAAVSAPSSLAVQTAQRFGITLAGFVRGERLNVYSVPARIAPATASAWDSVIAY